MGHIFSQLERQLPLPQFTLLSKLEELNKIFFFFNFLIDLDVFADTSDRSCLAEDTVKLNSRDSFIFSSGLGPADQLTVLIRAAFHCCWFALVLK